MKNIPYYRPAKDYTKNLGEDEEILLIKSLIPGMLETLFRSAYTISVNNIHDYMCY